MAKVKAKNENDQILTYWEGHFDERSGEYSALGPDVLYAKCEADDKRANMTHPWEKSAKK